MQLEQDIFHTYLTISQTIDTQFRDHFGKQNLTFLQAMVLNHLKAEGTMPVSTLASYTGSANATITGVVDRLERAGRVHRVRSKTDRRVVYVELVPQPETQEEKDADSVMDYFDNMMSSLSTEEKAQVYSGLQLFARALKAHAEA